MTKPREDLLISVCFVEQPRDAQERAQLKKLAETLQARWRYWEILIVSDKAHENAALLDEIANLRLLSTRRATQIYRRRVIAASEAIGDVVVMSAFEDLLGLDVMAMLDTAERENAVVIGRRAHGQLLFDPLLRAIGYVGGFRVQSRDLPTAAYPRTLINKLLARSDRQLALRFPPHDGGIPVLYQVARADALPGRQAGLRRRLGLMQKLMVNAAPSVLSAISLLSILVIVSAVFVAIYAVMIWLFLKSVQPGWFSTTLVNSLTAAFLGVATFGLATGLLKLIDLATPDALDDVIDERASVDLFARVSEDLNIETGAALPVPPPERR